MKNFVQAGSNITLPSPAAVASGAGVLVGALFGVAAGTAAEGADLDLVTFGVFDLPKASGAITLGAALFWDNTNKLITTTASGNTRVGVAVRAAGSGDATARVRLNGSF